MKWFKHKSTSLSDPFIYDLIDQFGGDGYLAYFGIIELMSDNFDIKSPGVSTFSYRFLSGKLQLSRQKLNKFLNYFEKRAKIYHKDDKDTVTLNCPKLKEMSDEYTQKLIAKCRDNVGTMSGACRENICLEEDIEEEEDKKKNINPPISPLLNFNQFWKAYPCKKSKGQAETTWKKIKPDAELLEKILTGIESAKLSHAWKKDDGEYIPYPSTWLRAKGWEDEHTEHKQSRSGAKPMQEPSKDLSDWDDFGQSPAVQADSDDT